MSLGLGFEFECLARQAVVLHRRRAWNFYFRRLVFLLCFCLLAMVLKAEPSALIITGLSPSADGAAQFLSLATQTKKLLVKRGFPEKRVEILHKNVTRDLILKKLRGLDLTTNDEFWLVLYGITGRSQGDEPAFQIHGPRLTANDLKLALDAIPARQFVFIGTGNGGSFLPVLHGPRRTVLSATQAAGEPSFPRFPKIWLKVFGENPHASFAEMADRASAEVASEYDSLHLAVTEHALLADPATGKILEAPFGVSISATNLPASSPSPPK